MDKNGFKAIQTGLIISSGTSKILKLKAVVLKRTEY